MDKMKNGIQKILDTDMQNIMKLLRKSPIQNLLVEFQEDYCRQRLQDFDMLI